MWPPIMIEQQVSLQYMYNHVSLCCIVTDSFVNVRGLTA